MKKKKLFSFLVLLLALSIKASAEGINTLVLHMTSGKEVICSLEEQPVVTFTANEVVLTTSKEVVSYNSSDVQRFEYTYITPESIDDVNVSGSMVSINGEIINLRNLNKYSIVSIFSADGKLIAESKTDANGNASLTLPQQSGNVYIIKTSVSNFKITRP